MDKALIFYQHSRQLTGSTFNMFEYFITILEHNPDFKLIILNAKQNDKVKDIDYYCNIFENRYDLNDIDYKKNILALDYKDIVKLNRTLKKILVLDYGTVIRIKNLVPLPKIIHLAEKTDDPNYRFSSKSDVTIYGEMPFHIWDVKYRMKLAFKRFKKLNTVEKAVYIYSPLNEDTSYIKSLNIPKDKRIILKTDNHLANLFEQFDEYIYYHGNKVWDQHPRLFLECAYYNKKITYINNYGVKDGSYYRYHDLMKNGLKNRTLTKDDAIVKLFI